MATTADASKLVSYAVLNSKAVDASKIANYAVLTSKAINASKIVSYSVLTAKTVNEAANATDTVDATNSISTTGAAGRLSARGRAVMGTTTPAGITQVGVEVWRLIIPNEPTSTTNANTNFPWWPSVGGGGFVPASIAITISPVVFHPGILHPGGIFVLPTQVGVEVWYTNNKARGKPFIWIDMI